MQDSVKASCSVADGDPLKRRPIDRRLPRSVVKISSAHRGGDQFGEAVFICMLAASPLVACARNLIP